jgi:processive 1,2-diacylglycerol beta-glucosyltransferase
MAERASERLRFLIVYASAGAGHRAAADAIATAVSLVKPDAVVETADVLADMPYWFRRLYADGYIALAEHHPAIWRLAYDRGGDISRAKPSSSLGDRILRRLGRRFVERVSEFKPDVVLSAHFMATSLLRDVKVSSGFRLCTVITDYCTHGAWLVPGNDRLYVASEQVKYEAETRLDLLRMNVDDILATGIPIHPRFAERSNADALRGKFGLDPDLPVVLVMTGMAGSSHTSDVIDALCRVSNGFTLVVASGSGETLSNKTTSVLEERGIEYRVFGRVPFLDELMEMADFAVSKSGGLASTELMSKGSPLIVYRPYPGQEERNAAHFLAEGAAFWAMQPESIGWYADRLLTDTKLRTRMSAAARRIAEPRAAKRIARDLVSLAGTARRNRIHK